MEILNRSSLQAKLAAYAVRILVCLLILAPLIKGGNRPLPLLILELAALAMITIFLIRQATERLPKALVVLIGLMFGIPLLQMFPVPTLGWAELPGRQPYVFALNAVNVEPAFRAVSLSLRQTEAAFFALLPPVAVFLSTVVMSDERIKFLVKVFIAVAAVQAIIGLAQYGTGSPAILWHVEGLSDRRALGTYANRDHLAGLLEMALPIALALFAASFVTRSAEDGRHRLRATGTTRTIRNAFSAGIKVNEVGVLASASIAILLGLVFTRSRTGVALGMLGILLCTIAFARHLGGERSVRLATIISAVGLGLAVEIGLAPVLSRFAAESLANDLRWSIFMGALEGIAAFFPIGSGFGTFPEVFRFFQPGDVPKFVNHAHNDVLEWLFDGGFLAAAVILAILFFYIRRWPKIWRVGEWSKLRYVQVAAGISVLLLGLHALVDFNFHIPANTIYFAFLMGVYFHEESGRNRAGRRPAPKAAPGAPVAPSQSVQNPFAE